MDNVFTVKHWGVIVAMIAILVTGFGVIATKADKEYVDKSEARTTEKVSDLKQDMKDMTDKLERKQDKIIDLLLKMQTNTGG